MMNKSIVMLAGLFMNLSDVLIHGFPIREDDDVTSDEILIIQ